MPNKSQPPEIELLKLSDLTVDLIYSGRTEKEIAANAKELAPLMAAFGSWDSSQPGAYFEQAGNKVLCAGFTRVEAAKLNGYKIGAFVKRDGDDISHLLSCITTNAGKPISSLAQGARYASLRDGVLSDDFAEAIADPKNPEHWKRQPMTLAEIAERIGKTAARVSQCVNIFEAPPEVAEMIEVGKISDTVYQDARSVANKHFDGSDAKVVAMCRRAYSVAKADGKESATRQHFAAIKPEFVKQKAVSKSDAPAAPKPGTSFTDGSFEPANDKNDSSGDSGAKNEPSKDREEQEESLAQATLELPISTPTPKPPTKKETKTIRESALTIILETDTEVDDDLATRIVDRLLDAGLLAAHLPF